MSVFRVDYKISAVAFINAESKKEAIETAKSVVGETIELTGDIVREPDIFDADSPPIIFLPTGIIGSPDIRRMDTTDDRKD